MFFEFGNIEVVNAMHHVSFLEPFLDSLPLGVLIADTEGRVVYCNTAQSRIDDMDVEYIVGKSEAELYGPYVGPGIMRSCQEAGKPILGFVCHYRTVKGRIINGAYWVYPLFAKGSVVASLCITQQLNLKTPLFPPSQILDFGQIDEMTQQDFVHKEPKKGKKKEEPLHIVGGNKAFRRVLSMAETTASSPSPVLICGETGCGKEMLVKAIRAASNRNRKPYMAINCSAIPSTLLEGLLLGSTKGSFTGAVDRPGLLEQANGGIIYLDEIDSMPLELQPKLLRVLQDLRVRRLGSSEERELDIKVISSISDVPEKVLNQNRLRPDLFYRLAVISLRLPPLRERMDDLGDLISHFTAKYNKSLGKQIASLDPEVEEMFRLYDWPGNIRELEHVIAGAINLTAWENVLHLHHIPEHQRVHLERLRVQKNSAAAPLWKIGVVDVDAYNDAAPPSQYKGFALPQELPMASAEVFPPLLSGQKGALTLEEQEAKLIREALEHTRGHMSNAAKMLGITRQLLNYKTKKHGIERNDFKIF